MHVIITNSLNQKSLLVDELRIVSLQMEGLQISHQFDSILRQNRGDVLGFVGIGHKDLKHMESSECGGENESVII
jgi:hypothetical protein